MEVKILTTKKRTDRLLTSLRNLQDFGINPEVFYALEDSQPKVSFNKSMKHLMSLSEGHLLLFEDDVWLKSFEHFNEAFSQLPSDWEVCYLGANLIDPIEKYSENLYRTFGAWTTHAVIYNNPKKLFENYNDTNFMFDEWIRQNICPRGTAYIMKPMMAWQRPSQSDLWDHYADYVNIFELSANKLI